MASDSNYVLSVGKDFEDRLLRLNNFCNPYSFNFLRNAGLKKGDHVIDIGCGIGELTCWIAEQVGPHGHVTAIDISIEQLELAKARAHKRQLNNIEFRELSIYDLHKLNRTFNLGYSRFVMDHVADQMQALQAAIEIIDHDGILCLESSALSTCTNFSYPENSAYTKHMLWFNKLRNTSVWDSEFGMRLPNMLKQLGMQDANLELAQPILKTVYQREHCLLLTQECAKSYLKHGIATDAEITELVDELKQMIADENIQLAFFIIAQVVATKKTSFNVREHKKVGGN